MGRQVGAVVADEGGREGPFEHREGTAGQVDGDGRIGLVHGQDEAVAGDTAAFAQRLLQGLAEGDGRVLDGVVRVGVQVAFAGQAQGEAAVGGDLLQHVVEEADAGGDGDGAGGVEIDGADDAGLPGVADGLAGAVGAAGCGAEAERGDETVVDLGPGGDGQTQPVAGAFGSEAEAGEGGEDAVGVGRAGHDHGTEARLDRHVAGEGLDQPVTLRSDEGDTGRRLHHPRGVERLQGEADGDLGQGIGLKHRGEAGEGGRLTEGSADPGAGESPGEREAAQDDQVGVVGDGGRRGGGVGELGHALVNDQQGRGDPFGHLGRGLGRAEGAEDDGAGRGIRGGCGVEGGEGAVRLGVGGFDPQAVTRGEAEDQFEAVGQAADRQDAVGGHAIDLGHAGGQSAGLGRIAVEAVAAGDQRGERSGQVVHAPVLRSAARAWASRPSSRARRAATGARAAAPASVTAWTDMVVMKLAVVTPPMVRAAPSVGRTWLGPAA